MFDWFIDLQLKIFGILGSLSVLMVFLFDFRGPQTLAVFLFTFAMVFVGQKIFVGDTSENWLQYSYFGLLKNTIGGGLVIVGWFIFLRGVVAVALASIILKAD